MTIKEEKIPYERPLMEVIPIQMRGAILDGSEDEYYYVPDDLVDQGDD